MPYHVWGGDTRRPTRDLDLLGHGDPDTGRVAEVFRRIIAAEVTDDGLKFSDPVAEPIREDASYGGVRVKMTARLGNIRIPIQVDKARQAMDFAAGNLKRVVDEGSAALPSAIE